MKLRDENKIARIYKATLKLVKATGLSGITMQAVAKEAKIATGTLYIYFQNKETLIASVFQECIKNSQGSFFKNYDAKAPFKVGFHIIWLNVLNHRLLRFEESLFIEQAFHSPYIDEQIKVEAKKMFEPLKELLARGKKEHLVKDVDNFWLTAFMIGSINEISRRVNYYNKKLNSEVIDLNFQLCWDGIKA